MNAQQTDPTGPARPSARELFERMPVTLPQEAKTAIERSLRQQLASAILEMIARTQEEVHTTLQGALEDVDSLSGLIIKIRALCEEEVKQ